MKQTKPLHVLVVEDAELPAHVAKMLLEAKGCIVNIAATNCELKIFTGNFSHFIH